MGGAHPTRAPALFVSHGSPMVALADDDYTRALAAFGTSHPRPRAILAVSAHWEEAAPIRVGAHRRPSIAHDFGGFPDALYRLTYAAPGAPELAAGVAARLAAAGIPATLDRSHGLDHGVWIPLRLAYPEADVPVVPVSLPSPGTPLELLRLGETLAPVRDEGVLVLGSGGLVHNLGRLAWEDPGAPVEAWARQFDDWMWARVAALDLPALAAYRRLAPHAHEAAPTTEHLDPLFVVLGSATGEGRLVDVYAGFRHGTLSMRSFALC